MNIDTQDSPESDLKAPKRAARPDRWAAAAFGAFFVILLALGLSPEGTNADVEPAPPLETFADAPLGVPAEDAAMLVAVLDTAWSAVRTGEHVPALAPASLPAGLGELTALERKTTFVRAILPHVLHANRTVDRQRREIESIVARLDAGAALREGEENYLADAARRYKLADRAEALLPQRALELGALLLERVDVIPPSLVLAQAAKESGWGSSRFVVEGNNLFGMRVFSRRGMTPQDKPEGKVFSVARYGSLAESVNAYLKNLNTHWAYDELRRIRTEARRAGAQPDSLAMARGLIRYSVLGEQYVSEIRDLIRYNRLREFDGKKLLRVEQSWVRDVLRACAMEDTATPETTSGV